MNSPSVLSKVLRRFFLLGLSGCWVFSAVAATPAQGYFRIQGDTNTVITGFTSSGWLTWTNAGVGTTCTVEWAGSLGISNDWKTFVNYPVIEPVCQVQAYVPIWPAPTGMSFIVTTRFQMGDVMEPPDGWTDELPLHNVYVTPFLMDQREVSKALWDEVYGWATNHGYGFDNVGFGKGTNYPVESVNWYDAVKWCNARSEKEALTPAYLTYEIILDEYLDPVGTNIVAYKAGIVDLTVAQVDWAANGYRLPTEAEWELAARGGVAGHRFPWSEADTITQSNANYYSFGDGGATYAYDLNTLEGYLFYTGPGTEPFTGPVGSFLPNGYGLFDMAGNVSEWCWDWYDEGFYTNVNASVSDTRGPSNSSVIGRVVRGGEWSTGADQARCSFRSHADPASSSPQNNSRGFRCVRGR
jgi:formylglycine-generating enzyme required for sulfatase activity